MRLYRRHTAPHHTCRACLDELDCTIFMSRRCLQWSECESEDLELPSEPQADVLMLLKPLGILQDWSPGLTLMSTNTAECLNP